MNKSTLAKLNNVLKGLELSKEQKQMLVEVFDEIGSNSNGGSGSGGGESGTIYVNMITYYEQEPIIKIDDYEIAMSECTIIQESNSTVIKIYNTELYNRLRCAYDAKYKVFVTEYQEVLEFNLVRPLSYTYAAIFGYVDHIPDYISIKLILEDVTLEFRICS